MTDVAKDVGFAGYFKCGTNVAAGAYFQNIGRPLNPLDSQAGVSAIGDQLPQCLLHQLLLSRFEFLVSTFESFGADELHLNLGYPNRRLNLQLSQSR